MRPSPPLVSLLDTAAPLLGEGVGFPVVVSANTVMAVGWTTVDEALARLVSAAVVLVVDWTTVVEVLERLVEWTTVVEALE